MLRWMAAAVSFGSLATIGAVAVVYGSGLPQALWWLVFGLASALGVVLWRLAGRRVLTAWRKLGLPKWVLPAGLFSGFLAVKLMMVFSWQTEQWSDFLIIWRAAESIAVGDYSFSQEAYWVFFAYQTPFAIYEAVMLKLFGGSWVPLLAVNALAMAGVNLLTFLFARRLTGSAVAGLAIMGAGAVWWDGLADWQPGPPGGVGPGPGDRSPPGAGLGPFGYGRGRGGGRIGDLRFGGGGGRCRRQGFRCKPGRGEQQFARVEVRDRVVFPRRGQPAG
ncbi:MAG: hypothetical protein LBJ02_07080 [Bifidobacteriaceae bacterium]|nr:hypothetical protein [Bifidobacteriaceae bacterium]